MARALHIIVEAQRHASSKVGHELMHGRHVPDTQRPLGHYDEHVAGNSRGKVGCHFGLAQVQIGH
jgi:hypothetical protein